MDSRFALRVTGAPQYTPTCRKCKGLLLRAGHRAADKKERSAILDEKASPGIHEALHSASLIPPLLELLDPFDGICSRHLRGDGCRAPQVQALGGILILTEVVLVRTNLRRRAP